MNDQENIENFLERIEKPSLAEGQHRARLEKELLEQYQKKATTMNGKRSIFTIPIVKIAAGVLAAVVLVASGWAAEKVYEVIKMKPVYTKALLSPKPFILSSSKTTTAKGDGNTVGSVTVSATGLFMASSTSWNDSSGQPKSEEEIKALIEKRDQEISKLIAEKKYKLAKVEKRENRTQYYYIFKLSDGSSYCQNFGIPLEEVQSLDDYNRKSRQLEEQRQAVIMESINQGRYTLIDIDLIKIHICRDKADGNKISVQQINLPDGRQIAHITPYPLPKIEENKWNTEYEMDWKDHLKAISDGSRELLDVEVCRSYTYNITLPDGTVVKWNVGSRDQAPLPTKEQQEQDEGF